MQDEKSRDYKFAIITPTHKRPESLKRCTDSLTRQNYAGWEMIIINDSPDHDYKEIEKYIQSTGAELNGKIKYYKNNKNLGKNYSCNFAIQNISSDIDYIIFLDDDDWLSENALYDINQILINKNNLQQHQKNCDPLWLVTNRFDTNRNKSITINNTKKEYINYLKDYLILKKFKGDATHIISTKIKSFKNIHFPNNIKNGEEWFYFTQVNNITSGFYYHNLNTTLSQGYDAKGITNNYKNKIERLKNTYILFTECLKNKNIKINNFLYLLLYFILRTGSIILKK